MIIQIIKVLIIMSVFFQGYENQIQRKQVDYQPGENIQQAFQKLLENHDVADELGFQIDINNVIIVLKKDKTRKISPDQQIETLIQQSKQKDLELILVFPNEEGAVLIEYIVDKKYCYFQNYVNKNDQLENFLNALCKRINYEKRYEIKVNGQKSNPRNPLEKKTIKQLMASSSSQKIVVEIKQQNKVQEVKQSKAEAKKDQEYQNKVQKGISRKVEPEKKISPNKQSKPNVSAKQKITNQSVYQSIKSIAQSDYIIPNGTVPHNQKLLEKKQQWQEQQQSKPLPPIAQEENSSRKKAAEKNQKFTFSINFETNFGIRSLSYEVERTKTMKDILPEVLTMLIQAGFEWDISWKDQNDYKDRLAIFYGKQQYRKIDSKFISLLPTNKKTHDFHFQRIFEGG